MLKLKTYRFLILFAFAACKHEIRDEKLNATSDEDGLLNNEVMCENDYYKNVSQIFLQSTSTYNSVIYHYDRQKIMKFSSELGSKQKDKLEIVFKQLKRLKYKRKILRREIKLKNAVDKYFKEYIQTFYDGQEFLYEMDLKLKGTLDYIEGLANFAATSKNLVLIIKLLQFYEKYLAKNGFSPRVLFHKANIFILMSQLHQSSEKFNQAIESMITIMAHPNISHEHFKMVAEKSVEFFETHKFYSKAIYIQQKLALKFRTNTDILNKLGRLYQKIRETTRAKQIYQESLQIKRNDGYALFHLGYVMYIEEIERNKAAKTRHPKRLNTLEKSVNLMKKGLETRHPSILKDQNFAILGYALNRLGNIADAEEVFQYATNANLFSSFWQRSTSYIQGIRSKPIWTMEETNIGILLEYIRKMWKLIRKEAIKIFNQHDYDRHEEYLINEGKWHVYALYRSGKRLENNCLNAPITCRLIDSIPQISDNHHGDVKFSLMEAGTHITAHSGPTNCRLRIHLGLDVPLQPQNKYGKKPPSHIRITNQYKTWKNGEMLIFDDSFDHEVFHNDPRNGTRLILIIDMWHPHLTENQIASL